MKLSEIIGTNSAISPLRGLTAYNFVVSKLSSESKIIISFEGITECTSAFCNSFVGKLYQNFGPTASEKLILTDIDSVWENKIESSILLGTNSGIRDARKKSFENLIFA